MPNAVFTALTSVKRLPCFAMTLANAISARSSITSPAASARPYRPGSARPCSGERSCPAKLTIQPRSVGVEEDRIADFHLDVAVAHRVAGAHALTDPLRPALEHAKA